MVSKTILTSHCSKKLFWTSQSFAKFLVFSLEFQTFFLITRTMVSHQRSEQFWKQNTNLSKIVIIYNFDDKNCKHPFFFLRSRKITPQRSTTLLIWLLLDTLSMAMEWNLEILKHFWPNIPNGLTLLAGLLLTSHLFFKPT